MIYAGTDKRWDVSKSITYAFGEINNPDASRFNVRIGFSKSKCNSLEKTMPSSLTM